ncbi:MAG: tetratricopeptide repeat protein [Nitrospira sp.]|jgi:tetratricopeptide (TPR) repeat protein|nr:tetratricopeptide repeat protein [Nitrospira sp.]
MASGSQAGNAAEIDRHALALAKDPGSKAFIPLAEEYGKAGMWAEAAGVLEDGLKQYPGFITAMVALGRAYDQMGQPTKAKAILEEAIKISPENLRAHRTLAKIYAAEGATEAALRSCTVILAANPSDQESLSIRASLGIPPPPAPAAKSIKPVTPPAMDASRKTPPPHDAAVSVATVEAPESAPLIEPAEPDAKVEEPSVVTSGSIECESVVIGNAEQADSSPALQPDDARSVSEPELTPAATVPPARHQAAVEKLEQWLRFIQTRRRDRPSAETVAPTSYD